MAKSYAAQVPHSNVAPELPPLCSLGSEQLPEQLPQDKGISDPLSHVEFSWLQWFFLDLYQLLSCCRTEETRWALQLGKGLICHHLQPLPGPISPLTHPPFAQFCYLPTTPESFPTRKYSPTCISDLHPASAKWCWPLHWCSVSPATGKVS